MKLWISRPRGATRIVVILLALASLYPLKGIATLTRRDAWGWFPAYVASLARPKERVPDSSRHVVFVMVDHFEPGFGPEGAETSARWLEKFRAVADRHVDSRGNRFRYTWFYPYDERNEGVLDGISAAARDGYGEVELHWHHPRSSNAEFPGQLDEAVRWFQGRGALVSGGETAETAFAFIHGVWALDGSQPRCGVTRELDILRQRGCYADFTFSTVGTPSQPRKINSIYYARDTDAAKSYDDGDDARVGVPGNDGLMIFQGPIGFDPVRMRIEYGAVEAWAIPTPRRIERWIDTNIHVLGRPEWVFVKVYSHGVQSSAAILERHLDRMLGDLEEICRSRRITLHYMTAREAYNVVKAAEEGKTGDPEEYRDHRIARPSNLGAAHHREADAVTGAAR